eukprot:3206555-Prymnesium_polylepis.1
MTQAGVGGEGREGAGVGLKAWALVLFWVSLRAWARRPVSAHDTRPYNRAASKSLDGRIDIVAAVWDASRS